MSKRKKTTKTPFANPTPKVAGVHHGGPRAEVLEAIYLEALHLAGRGDADLALRLLDAVIRHCPGHGMAILAKGCTLSDLGAHGPAVALARQAVELMPGRALPLASLGMVLLRSGVLAEAEATLERAVQLDPDHPFGLTILATCLNNMGKTPERAEHLLRKALIQLPDEQSVWHNLGRALEAQGKLAEADQAFHRSIQIEPGTQTAKASAARRLALALRRLEPSGSPSNN